MQTHVLGGERRKKVLENPSHSNMPKIVFLSSANEKLTKYRLVMQAFAEYQKSSSERQKAQVEETFHMWSKGGEYEWKSDKTILISIQATQDFADFLVERYGVSTQDKPAKYN